MNDKTDTKTKPEHLDVVRVGGAISKDQAAYDLRSLLIGSEAPSA